MYLLYEIIGYNLQKNHFIIFISWQIFSSL